MSSKKEFKVNDFISLELENETTNIYVKGKLFQYFFSPTFDVPLADISYSNQVRDLEGEEEALARSFEDYQKNDDLQPEIKFRSFCSAIQTWVEHKYDTRVLPSNLTFPLLQRLMKAGDPIAKGVFKEEIFKRFSSGHPTVIIYLIEKEFTKYLGEEELYHLITPILNVIEKLDGTVQDSIFKNFVWTLRGTDVIQERFPDLLNAINTIDEEAQYSAFNNLMHSVRKTEVINKYQSLIEEKFILLVSQIKNLDESAEYGQGPYPAFYELLYGYDIKQLTNKCHSLIDRTFASLLSRIGTISEYDQYYCLNDLLEPLTGTEFVKKKSTEILNLIEKLGKINQYSSFFSYIEALRGTKVVKERLSEILNLIEKFDIKDRLSAFSLVVGELKKIAVTKEEFTVLLNFIENLDGEGQYSAFSSLISGFKGTEILSNHRALIEKILINLLNKIEELDKKSRFYKFLFLITPIKDTEIFIKYNSLIENIFACLLNQIEDLDEEDQFAAFFSLIKSLVGTEIIKKYQSLIEQIYDEFLKRLDKKPDYNRYTSLLNLMDDLIRNEFIEKNCNEILNVIGKLDEEDRIQSQAINTFVKIFKRTEAFKTHFTALLTEIEKLKEKYQYLAFRDLISQLKEVEVLKEFQSLIEPKLIDLLKKIKIIYERRSSLFSLLDVIKRTELLKNYSSDFGEEFKYFKELVDLLSGMPSQKLAFVQAIICANLSAMTDEIPFQNVLGIYNRLCIDLGLDPSDISQIENYLLEFKRERIISEYSKDREIIYSNPDFDGLEFLLESIIRDLLYPKRFIK